MAVRQWNTIVGNLKFVCMLLRLYFALQVFFKDSVHQNDLDGNLYFIFWKFGNSVPSSPNRLAPSTNSRRGARPPERIFVRVFLGTHASNLRNRHRTPC